MHADKVLIEDHDRIRVLLKQLDDSGSDARQRRRLLNALGDELVVHVHIEDELFYPAVRAVSPLVAVALAEHRQIDDHMAATLRTDPASPRFAEEMGALHAAIGGHAGEEEDKMFPQSQALGDVELERLGKEMRGRQERLRRSKLLRLRVGIKRGILRHT